jgi:release factor glutamine methyltransferase
VLISRRLNDEKVSEAENSLELIFAKVLNKDLLREVRGENLEKIELTKEQIQKIDELVTTRSCSVPVQYILKTWEFRDLELNMKIPVFICRPETEELVSLIIQSLDSNIDYNIIEIGSGSGNFL